MSIMTMPQCFVGHAVVLGNGSSSHTTACNDDVWRSNFNYMGAQVDEEGHGGGCQTLLPRSSRALDATAAI